MPALTRISCHAVHKMAPPEREALARELYAVHARIFGGQEFEDFRHYVVDRPSWRTWIWVKHGADGAIVGYHATHVFKLEVQGRPSSVIRMEAGTLREARGRDLTMISNCARLFLLWLRAPWRSWCIFAALTHPSSYTFLSHYAPEIWPRVGTPTPPDVKRQMTELADTFGLDRVDEDNPMVRRVDWITLETEEERRRWQASRRPNTRLYIRSNPGYVDGHGLVTLIPVNGPILLRALANFVVGRAGRLARILFGGTPAPKWDETAQPPESILPPAVVKSRPRPLDGQPDFRPSRY